MALPLVQMPAYAHGAAFKTGRPLGVVVHSTESENGPGSAEAVAGPGWFGGSKAGTSAHKIVDRDSICEGVARNVVAYHAGPSGNSYYIAYEFCGRAGWSAAKWREPEQLQMLRNAAPHIAADLAYAQAQARWLSVVQVARLERGLLTHNDVRLAFPGTTTHTDPGPNFPYAELLQFVNEASGHPIIGAIRDAYARPGVGSYLGAPLMPEMPTSGSDKAGRYQAFERGFIFWHPTVDKGQAHAVQGAIGEKWTVLGREVHTGFPATDELTCPDKIGRYNHFAHPDGLSIYWTPKTGAHLIRGAIRSLWASLGWETRLGYPTTDEMITPDKQGRYNHFAGGAPGVGDASIYWRGDLGPQPIYGEIRKAWAAQGWETGPLGYPTSGEKDGEGGRVQTFERGSILWAGGRATVRRA